MSTTITDTTRADLYWLARGTTITAIRALPRNASAEAIRAAWDYRADGTTGDTLSVEIAHERWGFCRRGLVEFAAALGLDAAAEYTRAEIARALTPDARNTYSREIATAGL